MLWHCWSCWLAVHRLPSLEGAADITHLAARAEATCRPGKHHCWYQEVAHATFLSRATRASCSLQARTFQPSAPRLRRGSILRATSVPQTVAMLPIRKISNRRPVSLMTRLQAKCQKEEFTTFGQS